MEKIKPRFQILTAHCGLGLAVEGEYLTKTIIDVHQWVKKKL